jgi:hypothetical protein
MVTAQINMWGHALTAIVAEKSQSKNNVTYTQVRNQFHCYPVHCNSLKLVYVNETLAIAINNIIHSVLFFVLLDYNITSSLLAGWHPKLCCQTSECLGNEILFW